jgi:ABC-type amino acid transport system permease subunit
LERSHKGRRAWIEKDASRREVRALTAHAARVTCNPRPYHNHVTRGETARVRKGGRQTVTHEKLSLLSGTLIPHRWRDAMTPDFWLGTAGTVVLWAVSGSLAIALGLVLAAGSLSANRVVRLTARAGVHLTRGVPTSVLVIVAGMGMMRLPSAPPLPTIFPGTPAAFQHLAWGIVLALALGSAGHLAEIFRAAILALGPYRLEQATVLGLSWLGRMGLLARECAAIALPPTGARLVHHLHNTAFAALFPVADLFGAIQGQSNATFRVVEFVLLGCIIYVTLSALTWLLVRVLETALAPPVAERRKWAVITWW